jgi:hypothetical protein
MCSGSVQDANYTTISHSAIFSAVHGALALQLRSRDLVKGLFYATMAHEKHLDATTACCLLMLMLHKSKNGRVAFEPPSPALARLFKIVAATKPASSPLWSPLQCWNLVQAFVRIPSLAPADGCRSLIRHTNWDVRAEDTRMKFDVLMRSSSDFAQRLQALLAAKAPAHVLAPFVRYGTEQCLHDVDQLANQMAVEALLRAVIKSKHRDDAFEKVSLHSCGHTFLPRALQSLPA